MYHFGNGDWVRDFVSPKNMNMNTTANAVTSNPGEEDMITAEEPITFEEVSL